MTVTAEHVNAFAQLSGDLNRLHMDDGFARALGFRGRVVHGMIAASMVSQLIGMQIPGHGSLWMNQTFQWIAPVYIGDTLAVEVRKTKTSPGTQTISVEVTVRNQDGKTVMEGNGVVKVPEQRSTTRTVPLAERSALVTGGSSAIGAAIVTALAQAGTSVSVLYRNRKAETSELCARVSEAGGKAVAFEGDVTSLESMRAVVEQAGLHYGKAVDLLVNGAGSAYIPKPFLETSWQEFEQQFDVRVRGAVECCQAALPGMLAAGSGCIVNLGSTYAWGVPPAQWTGFASATAALQTMTRCLAAEFGPKGIRVNMISPGMAATTDRMQKVQAMQTPLRRLAEPHEIAAAVVFLCSEYSSSITGADIPVCGGSVM